MTIHINPYFLLFNFLYYVIHSLPYLKISYTVVKNIFEIHSSSWKILILQYLYDKYIHQVDLERKDKRYFKEKWRWKKGKMEEKTFLF